MRYQLRDLIPFTPAGSPVSYTDLLKQAHPCPVCDGGPDRISVMTTPTNPPSFAVVCSACEFIGPDVKYLPDAVKKWNKVRRMRRPSPIERA